MIPENSPRQKSTSQLPVVSGLINTAPSMAGSRYPAEILVTAILWDPPTLRCPTGQQCVNAYLKVSIWLDFLKLPKQQLVNLASMEWAQIPTLPMVLKTLGNGQQFVQLTILPSAQELQIATTVAIVLRCTHLKTVTLLKFKRLVKTFVLGSLVSLVLNLHLRFKLSFSDTLLFLIKLFLNQISSF